jgi:hypothetical protein
LRNWVESARKKQLRAQGLQFDKVAFWAEIAAEIPEQSACDAIANTAKHANFGDENWPGGSVVLEWQDGDEDAPPGYVLLHRTEDASLGFAVNRFAALCDNWWRLLNRYGLAAGHNRSPDWQQRKLNRIFGRHLTGDHEEHRDWPANRLGASVRSIRLHGPDKVSDREVGRNALADQQTVA